MRPWSLETHVQEDVLVAHNQPLPHPRPLLQPQVEGRCVGVDRVPQFDKEWPAVGRVSANLPSSVGTMVGA